MTDDETTLRALTEAISQAEDRGDEAGLNRILAPRLAFQRADRDRTVEDRDAFLSKVKPSGRRLTRVIEPIQVFGDRAIVQCTIAIDGKEYHNLRMFVRRDGQWRLLGWANEAV